VSAVAGADNLGDLYELLGVDRGPPTRRSSAPMKACRELHPDNNPGDEVSEAKFKEVSLAYEVLRDPERRSVMTVRAEGVFSQGRRSPFDFDVPRRHLRGFFGQMRVAAASRRGPAARADAEVSLRLTFAEAAFGARKELSVRCPSVVRPARDRCRPGTSPSRAPTARTGEIRRIRQSLLARS